MQNDLFEDEEYGKRFADGNREIKQLILKFHKGNPPKDKF